VLAACLLGLVTMGGAFATVAFLVNRAQERQLDQALRVAAHEEAAELAADDPPGGAPPVISDRPGPAANDVGPLPKHVAVYWPDGTLASATDTFGEKVPSLDDIRHPLGVCFDTEVNHERLRAVLVPIPQHPGATLFIGVTRADLDGDAAFLSRAMMAVFGVAVAWTAILAWWIVGRLTRPHRAIVAIAKRVSAGDLGARMRQLLDRDDPEGLARNVDDMIDRLALLLEGQQRFVAQAAHELRSPLTALYGELSLALRRERSPEEYRQTIERALAASRSLKILAEDLLSLARLGTEPRPGRETARLAEVTDAARHSVEPVAHQRSVTLDLQVPSLTVDGRQPDLERLFRNLLENAVRHSPQGGAVLVRSDVARDAVRIRIYDSGTGVPPADRPRIFDPFFRGGRARAYVDVGTGLGLTIARDIARLQRGDLVLMDTESGEGACFEVTLRRAAAEPAAPAPSTPALPHEGAGSLILRSAPNPCTRRRDKS